MESISLELNSSVSNSVQSTGERTVSTPSAEEPLDLSIKTSSHEITSQQFTVPVHNYYLPPLQSLLNPTFISWFLSQGYVAPTPLLTARQLQNGSTIADNVPTQVPSLSWPKSDNEEGNGRSVNVHRKHYQAEENNLIDKIKVGYNLSFFGMFR